MNEGKFKLDMIHSAKGSKDQSENRVDQKRARRGRRSSEVVSSTKRRVRERNRKREAERKSAVQ